MKLAELTRQYNCTNSCPKH